MKVRTRWLVVAMAAGVAAIGGAVYTDESARSEAALEDLGAHQAELAQVASLTAASGRELAAIGGSDAAILLRAADGTLRSPDGHQVECAELADALTRGEQTVRLSRAAAAQLGLPERVAMAGAAALPDGRRLVLARSAQHQRDRDRSGRLRVVLSVVLAGGLMAGFAAAIAREQRRQGRLVRELAVSETARARDAELERVSRAATMAAIGSGVAHELGTPLAVIIGRAEQLLGRLGDDERAARSVRAILEEAENMNGIIRGVLGLARGAPVAMQQLPASELVADAIALVEHRFARAAVRIEASGRASALTVRCEPLLFKHAVVNLLLNACDASSSGDVVVLDVRADGDCVAFVVDDDGAGISAEHAARAIEPFFTTKPPGQGTGLGLAIANEIAKTHRGSLSIGPRPGVAHGTRAELRLPRDPGASA